MPVYESDELTLEKLDELINQLPQLSYPKRIRISHPDYRNLPCLVPNQKDKIFMGIIIEPDLTLKEGEFEVDY